MQELKEHIATKKLVPQLRFKEFDGEWAPNKIEDVANKVTSGSRDWAQYYSESGDKFIRMTNLPKRGINLLLDDMKYVALPKQSSEGKRTSLDSGDILISITAELGKIGWVPDNLGIAYINQHTALVKLTSEVDSKYVAYQLSTNRNNKKLNRLNDSGAKSGLNLSTIRSFSIPFPLLSEQQKIASFLSALDEKIQQLTKKKELLEQYKKGVMQQLFSGQLRFKDENGNPYPDWEEKILSEIATKSSSNISANTIEENFGEFKIYGASGMLKKIDFHREKEPFVSIVKDGAGVGRTLLCDENSSVLGTLDIIKPKIKVVLYFLYSVLNNIRFEKYIVGSTIPHIYFKDYSNERITIPCFEEQQKIATYLSSIDTKIDSVKIQITQTQTFKKGLLQQLFV